MGHESRASKQARKAAREAAKVAAANTAARNAERRAKERADAEEYARKIDERLAAGPAGLPHLGTPTGPGMRTARPLRPVDAMVLLALASVGRRS